MLTPLGAISFNGDLVYIYINSTYISNRPILVNILHKKENNINLEILYNNH